jgi:hypothetical protein
MNTQKKKNTKKRKSQKESVPVSPALYHGIFMLKSNVGTPGLFLVHDVSPDL